MDLSQGLGHRMIFHLFSLPRIHARRSPSLRQPFYILNIIICNAYATQNGWKDQYLPTLPDLGRDITCRNQSGNEMAAISHRLLEEF